MVFLIGPTNYRSQRAVEKIGAVRAGSRRAAGREPPLFNESRAPFPEQPPSSPKTQIYNARVHRSPTRPPIPGQYGLPRREGECPSSPSAPRRRWSPLRADPPPPPPFPPFPPSSRLPPSPRGSRSRPAGRPRTRRTPPTTSPTPPPPSPGCSSCASGRPPPLGPGPLPPPLRSPPTPDDVPPLPPPLQPPHPSSPFRGRPPSFFPH